MEGRRNLRTSKGNSITNGVGSGFISYCLIKVVQGKAAEVKPLMWVAALAFLVMFIFG